MNISIDNLGRDLLENNMRMKKQPWRELEKRLIKDVVETRNLSLFTGKYLHKAEQLMESIYPGKYAILLNSGTAALHIALKTHGIGPGDEVILPSITYPATALAIMHAGARPIFAEIDPFSYTLDPDSCDKLISENTKAVIFVHLFGVLGNIEAVTDLCKSKGIVLIEDCAQAFGSSLKGKQAGTFGQAGCFSFFESKTISAGEGGALILSDKNLVELGRRYRHHGMDVLTNERSVTVEGFNYKPSEFQSALVFAQLTHKEDIMQQRIHMGLHARSLFPDSIKHQSVQPDEVVVWDKICILFKKNETQKNKEKLAHKLGLFRYIRKPLYREPVFSQYKPNYTYPNSEMFCNNHLVIQIAQFMESNHGGY